MMGIKNVEAKVFYEFSLDRRVPEDHLLRRIEHAVDFSFVYSLTRPYYSHTGQPSVDPVAVFKMALLGYLYGLASERRLAQEVELNLAYRWFLGYDLDEATPNHSVLSKARRRFGKPSTNGAAAAPIQRRAWCPVAVATHPISHTRTTSAWMGVGLES
jgi:transposase